VDSLGRAADIYQVYTGQWKLEALINQMLLYVVSQSPVAAARLANYKFNGERNRACGGAMRAIDRDLFTGASGKKTLGEPGHTRDIKGGQGVPDVTPRLQCAIIS